jgi:hypothetical protein
MTNSGVGGGSLYHRANLSHSNIIEDSMKLSSLSIPEERCSHD